MRDSLLPVNLLCTTFCIRMLPRCCRVLEFVLLHLQGQWGGAGHGPDFPAETLCSPCRVVCRWMFQAS
jgi:hypothetical protein